MPKPDWTWLIVGIILGVFIVPRALALIASRKG